MKTAIVIKHGTINKVIIVNQILPSQLFQIVPIIKSCMQSNKTQSTINEYIKLQFNKIGLNDVNVVDIFAEIY